MEGFRMIKRVASLLVIIALLVSTYAVSFASEGYTIGPKVISKDNIISEYESDMRYYPNIITHRMAFDQTLSDELNNTKKYDVVSNNSLFNLAVSTVSTNVYKVDNNIEIQYTLTYMDSRESILNSIQKISDIAKKTSSLRQ